MPISLATRKLLTSMLYMSSAICSMTNLALTGNGLTSADLAISICGIVPWGLAGAQSLYNKYQTRKKIMAAPVEILTPRVEQPTSWRGSTHALVNSSLHVVSSTFFIIGDLKDRQEILMKVLAPRLLGSFFWLKSASIGVWSSRKILRPAEDQPDVIVQSCGLDATRIDMISETDYIFAGVLYAISIWNNPTLIPLKAAGNLCWLLAGMHDIIEAWLQLQKKRATHDVPTVDEENPEPNPVRAFVPA